MCAVCAVQKKIKLSSDGGDSGSKECKRGYGGIWQSLRLARVWSLKSGSRFCAGVFGRNLAPVAMKMFSHLIHFIKKSYKFCTFNAICKENAAINCITVRHKKVSFPSTLISHTSVYKG
jgi:hypothetical protein